MAVRTSRIPVTIRTGIAAAAPAVCITFRTLLSAVFTDHSTVFTQITGLTLRFISTFQAALMASRTCRFFITVSADAATQTKSVAALLTLFSALTADICAFIARMTGIALLLCFTFKTAFSAIRTGGSAIAVFTGITAMAPATSGTLCTLFSARFTDCGAVLAIITIITLFFHRTLKTAFPTSRASSSPITTTAGITAITPAVITLPALFPAVLTDHGTILTGMAFIALDRTLAQKTGFPALRTDRFAITVRTGITATAPAVICTFDTVLSARFADRSTVLTVMTVIALLFLFTFKAGLAAARTGRIPVTVAAGITPEAPATITVPAFFSASLTDNSTVFTGMTFITLFLCFAIKTGLATARTGRTFITIRTGIAATAPAVIAFVAFFSASLTNSGTALAFITSPTLFLLFTFKTCFPTVRAGSTTVTIRTGIAAQTEIIGIAVRT